MFRRCTPLGCVAVGQACRALGFRVPPKDKKQLKTRFLTLAKEHHPDQNQNKEADSTQKMIEITEAYTTLKKLLDTDGGLHARDMHAAVNATQQRQARGETVDPSMQEVAASFVAPGASLSLHGFTLPWQRAATRSRAAVMMDKLDRSRDLSFGDYVSAVRAVEKERSHREAARQRDAKLSEGSHGFTAEYFAQLNEARRRFRRGSTGEGSDHGRTASEGTATSADAQEDLGKKIATGVVPLACRFYGKRLSAAVRHGPRRSWDALRYVVFGS